MALAFRPEVFESPLIESSDGPKVLPQLVDLPKDINLPSILPHREVFDLLGRMADLALKVPAASVGWVFGDNRPWARFLD
jgi:hypothetical protein